MEAQKKHEALGLEIDLRVRTQSWSTHQPQSIVTLDSDVVAAISVDDALDLCMKQVRPVVRDLLVAIHTAQERMDKDQPSSAWDVVVSSTQDEVVSSTQDEVVSS